MRRRLMTVAVATVAIAALAFGTGCTRVRLRDRPETRTTTEERSVDLEGAASLRTEIDVNVGELELSSTDASAVAMTGDFTFAPKDWAPDVDYRVDGGIGDLRVTQPEDIRPRPFRDMKSIWNVRLPQGVPTDLTVRVDVGRARIDLRGVDLTALDARTGVGDTTLDISGVRTRDLDAKIESSVGKLTLRVPRDVGVRVRGQEGVGSFSADGFISQGEDWVNSAYSGDGPKIEIDLVRGVGDVTLVMVD